MSFEPGPDDDLSDDGAVYQLGASLHLPWEPLMSPESQGSQGSQEPPMSPESRGSQPMLQEPLADALDSDADGREMAPQKARIFDLNSAKASVGAGQQLRLHETSYVINGMCRQRIRRRLQDGGICRNSPPCTRQCHTKFTTEEFGKVCDTSLYCYWVLVA